MNKLALAAAALLVLAVLALPGLVGSITEARVRERVAAIDSSPSAAAEVKSFERGWFRSTARVELRLAPDNLLQFTEAATDLGVFGTLPVAIEFAHGPVAVLDGVHFGWSKLVARADTTAPGITELERTLGVPYLFEYRGRAGYFGGLAFDADTPPFELPIDAALFTFSGATLAGTFASRRIDADARIGSFDLTSPTGTFALRGVYATVDNELRSEYVMPGTASFSIESIFVSESPQGTEPMFEAQNLRMQSDVTLDAAAELLEMRAQYDVDSVRLAANEVTAAALGVTFRNVDVATLEAYAEAAADAAASGDPLGAMASLGPYLERGLQAGPSVSIEPIRFRYDGEPFEGRIVVTAVPDRLPPAGTLELDVMRLLGLVNTDAEARVSKTLAGQLATLAARLQLAGDDSIPPDQVDYMAEAQSGLMLTLLVGQGVLLEDGDDYRTSLQFRDGKLTLNGNPLPFGL